MKTRKSGSSKDTENASFLRYADQLGWKMHYSIKDIGDGYVQTKFLSLETTPLKFCAELMLPSGLATMADIWRQNKLKGQSRYLLNFFHFKNTLNT